MKKIFKRTISVFLCVVLMLTSASLSFTAFAAGEPVFALDRISEDESKILVCVKLVSGDFMAVDFKIIPKSRKVSICEKIEDADELLAFGKEIKMNDGGILASVFNPASNAYSVAITSPYTKPNGQIAIYTFRKATSEVITASDLELQIASCKSSNGVVTPRTTNNLDTSGLYTVSFNADGGNVSPASKKVVTGSIYGDLPTPTRSGYSFDGWYTAASGGSKITRDSRVTLTANQTLYAHWVAGSYTVTFNANGGAVSPTSKNVKFDSAYGELPTPTRSGYTFDGWYTAKSGGTKITKDSKVTITSAQTLYARWNANSYTVNFNANGGNVSTASKSVKYDSTYGDLPTPTKDNYNFDGWFTAASSGTKITKDSKVTITAAQTLYAHWSAKSFTVTFNANGGNVSPASKSVSFNSTYGDLPTPTRNGYSFDGWFTAANGGEKVTKDSKVTLTANQTLYAHWTAKSFTVTFNANGGNVTPTSKSVKFDSSYGDLPIPTRLGYVFNGWYTAANEGTKVTKDSKFTLTANQTLYAHWDILLGDVNKDGNINSSDALIVLQHSVENLKLTDENFKRADVDGSGAVNSSDALLVLQYSIGQITKF